jgi:hypothetical protein
MSIRKGDIIIAGRGGGGVSSDAIWGNIKGDITKQQDLINKLNQKSESYMYKDKEASNWVNDDTYEEFPYSCAIDCIGTNELMIATVTFSPEDSLSGDYAPVCKTGNGTVTVYSKRTDPIIIPSILTSTVMIMNNFDGGGASLDLNKSITLDGGGANAN